MSPMEILEKFYVGEMTEEEFLKQLYNNTILQTLLEDEKNMAAGHDNLLLCLLETRVDEKNTFSKTTKSIIKNFLKANGMLRLNVCTGDSIFSEETKILNNTLLNPMDFEIEDDCCEDVQKGIAACKRLIEKWTPELETQMLEAFIKLYYDDMYEQWGPDDEEESKEYWPEIKSSFDLLKHTGKDVTLYALEDAIYDRSKTGESPYESQNVDVCVILMLNCPWEEEHGWAAVFVDEKFVKVGEDIVDCVWLDK